MERYEEIEKSIITTYRKKIWSQFIKGIKEFNMVQEGDKIAVCISGGKDSMLLAKCMQELKKHRQVNFDLVFLVMDPGYNPINRQKIINNAKLLNIPITMFETNIFEAVEKINGQRKIKKAAYEIGDNEKQKPGDGVYKNFEHELHGSGEQLYDNDDREHKRDGRKDKRGGFHIYTMTLSVPFFV